MSFCSSTLSSDVCELSLCSNRRKAQRLRTYFSYDVGQLSYNSKDSGVSPQVLVAILIAVLTVICAFILLLIFYR